VLVYGYSSNNDDYVRIGEDIILETVQRYTDVVIKDYDPEYLRAPNDEDAEILLGETAERGWPEMLGSIDFMH
jgi:hypothetical protein